MIAVYSVRIADNDQRFYKTSLFEMSSTQYLELEQP